MPKNDGPEQSALPPKAVRQIIEAHFLEQRKLFLWGEVNDESASDIIEKLLYFNSQDPKKEITFYINTPGGSTSAGMPIYDTMKLIEAPISVVVMGMAASFGAIILSGASKGRRFIYPKGRVMIHQPLISGKIVAAAVDIHIHAKEMERLREELNLILAKASGHPLKKIEEDTDRDFYLNAQEAIEYGLVDKIITEV